MHALLVSAGTYGNMLPFLGLGKALRARGHEVTLIGSGYCRKLAQREDLGFVDVDDPEDRHDMKPGETSPGKWRFLRILKNRALRQMPRIYRFLADRYVPGQTVVAAPGWLFGARLAQEKLGLPLATIQLQPLLFPRVHGGTRWGLRLLNKLIDRAMDRRLRPSIDAFRAEIGLPPLAQPIRGWWSSPERIIGFFPEWYSPAKPDWPSQTLLAGFPLYDVMADGDADADIKEYLAGGEPPLVFSQASQVKHARHYFAASIEVARLLGRRAVFLTAHREQLPPSLPPSVRHFDFIPLSTLLPHAAAIVHHGGIGTIAQALAAGVPQLTVPGMLDQFDNSRRLLRLGVSSNLRWTPYRPRKVARLLSGLLNSPEVRQNCHDYAVRCRADQPFEKACIALEHLHKTR
ncbi:MAG TPA: nucleotide disphospho-sugar-binding domain-containing protein [Gemmataceae bacterium]|nr:nucleotide disphospho-sugar-binding domain-containing protein [Gemmataceae bacterium]